MRWGLVVALTVVLAAAAMAQPAATPATGPAPASRLPELTAPLRLTPDAAAALAVQRSTQVAINQQQVASAQGKLDEVRSMMRAKVEGTASYTRSGPAQTFQLPGATGEPPTTVEIAPTSTHRESVQVTQPVYVGGRLSAAKRAAGAGIDAAREGIAATQVQTALAARQAVYAVLRLQELVVVTEQQATAVAEHLRIAKAMLEAGTAPRFEVVQAETELARAQGNVIHAKTAVAQAKAALTQLLNAPQGTEIVVEEGVPPRLPDGDRHALIGQALDQRPEIAVLEATVRAREALVRLAAAQYDPSVSLQGEVHNQSAGGLGIGGLGWSATAALAVPIFNGGEKQAKVAQAQADLATARLNEESAQQQIALQVTQALLNVEDARQALTVAEQGEVEARERLRIAQVRFGSGVGLGVEVLDAQTALAAAQTQSVNARYDLQVATAALRAALGLADVAKESSP